MNELATRNNALANVQDPVGDAIRLGELFESSGMFGCDKKGQGVVLALSCLSERKSPTELSRTYHIIKGKLSMKADAMLAGYRARGGKHIVIERSAKRAAARFIYGENDVTEEYTIEDARREGLAGSQQYQMRPKAMLWARLVSNTVRFLAPEVVHGLYTEEECEVMPEPKLVSGSEIDHQIEQTTRFKLDAIFSEYEPFVSEIAAEYGHITAGQTYLDVSEERALKWINNPEPLRKAARDRQFTARVNEKIVNAESLEGKE